MTNVCRNFYFLDYYIGKGLYLLLLASLILQHQEMLQWIVTVALSFVIVIDMVHGCLLGAEPINPPPEWDSTKSAGSTATENSETAKSATAKTAATTSATTAKGGPAMKSSQVAKGGSS